MKSRSHRIQPSDPPDEWVSESWTVDCSCGVTFDDGEEMVSCDECGVWVHTRCFRFVKNKSSTFLCHNCDKSNEETEVAQLLVDLPNKADTFPPLQYKNPVRMWAEAPLADRVHVQGIPGGDPGFFGKNSSIFGRQLWKCSGYVPKKFNIRYRDFECWEGESENVERGEDENIESEGADVLFSLSKEVVVGPVVPCVELKEAEKVLCSGRLNNWVKKERNKTRSFWLGCKKERSGMKKKARSSIGRVAAEFKKIGSTINSQMNMDTFSDDKALPVVESDTIKVDNAGAKEENKEYSLPQPKIGHQVEAHDNKTKHILIIKPSKSGPGVEMQVHRGNKLEMCANVETANATNRISSIVDPSTTFDINEKVDEGEGFDSKVVHDLNQPKDEIQMKGNLSKDSCPVILESKNSKIAIGTLIAPSPNGATSACSEHLKHNMENNAAVSKDPEDMQKNSICNTDDDSNSANHLNIHETRSHKTTSLPSTAHKYVDPDIEDDANNEDCAGNTMEMKTKSNELKQHNQVEEETQLKDSKLGHAKDFRKFSLPSEKQISISQKPRSATTTSIPVKNDSRQQRLNKEFSVQRSRHLVKGYSKTSEKSSHTSKISHASASKHTLGSASKTPAHDKIESLQMQNGSRGKNERMNQPVSESTSVPAHPMIPPSVATTLSDQELALLLHQQLNSSPRVPRASRMLRASDGQLLSQHASSGLSKRSSSSGGKEQQNFKKKGREDAYKDNSGNSQESNDETKRSGRDHKHQDFCKKNSRYRSPDTAVSRRKSTPGRLNEHERSDALSSKFSPRNESDNSVIATRTLPALIDDIMSKHNCSTYEELCDAVRPHWKNCRKPNGCRYAYPSHKHAVMDCLRNRSQWAYIIGRGPKTNSNKRKRKDASTADESEKEEDTKSKSSSTSTEAEPKKRDALHENDLPGGKQTTVKRRGLELRNQTNTKRKHTMNSGSSDSSSDSHDDDGDDDDGDDDKGNDDAVSSEDESQKNADRSEGEVDTSDSSSSDGSR